MHYIIDRFEGDLAICETGDKAMISIERRLIPAEASEGDILLFQDDAYQLDREATRERRQHMEERLKKLFS